jgi:hypothetical protein
MKRVLERNPFYTLIFPIATVLILASNNLGQIQLKVIWQPILYSFLFSLVIFALMLLIFRDVLKAGLFCFLLLFFVLTYGHFFNIMKDRVIGNWVIGTHFYMLIIWGLLLLVSVYFYVFKINNKGTITLVLNIAILFLTVFQMARITTYAVNAQIINNIQTASNDDALLQPEDPDKMPDVYYIILDKYARSDAIKKVYDYDNSAFIEALEEIGFFVPKCSRSNYAFTVMSLSSQLNMAYVEDLTDEPSLETTKSLIQNNLVHKAFEEAGYTTIGFDMGFSWGNMKVSDYYFDEYPRDIQSWSMTPFEIMYLKGTLGILFFEREIDLGQQITLSDLERKAERTLLILDVLPEIPKMTGPKFIHAHIISPHPPYLFNADGTLNPNAEEISASQGYPEQLKFLEPRILDIVHQIIDQSEIPPIIIIEGDHGFGKRYVTSILLALYLPDGGAEGLDDHMTMINVFPHIFNTYFGTEIELLPDISYTHTDDWYESVVQEEWNPDCRDD